MTLKKHLLLHINLGRVIRYFPSPHSEKHSTKASILLAVDVPANLLQGPGACRGEKSWNAARAWSQPVQVWLVGKGCQKHLLKIILGWLCKTVGVSSYGQMGDEQGNLAMIWRNPNSNQNKHLISTVKQGSRELVIWACSTMNPPYIPKRGRAKRNAICLAAGAWVELITTEQLKKKGTKVTKVQSRSSLIEKLWWDQVSVNCHILTRSWW